MSMGRTAAVLLWLHVICCATLRSCHTVTRAYSLTSSWRHGTGTTRPSYLVNAVCNNLPTNSFHGFPHSVPALHMQQSDGFIRNLNENKDIDIAPEKGKDTFHDFTDLDIIEFEGVLNFRSALPGSGLPIYRCAALDNATSSDAVRLLTPGIINSSASSDNKWYFLRSYIMFDLVSYLSLF